MTIHSMPEGTTEAQLFRLEADGSPINLTGLTLGIEIYNKNDVAVAAPGTAALVTPASGIVSFTPDATKFSATLSPYKVRWTVSNGSTLFKVPNGVKPDLWQVSKP